MKSFWAWQLCFLSEKSHIIEKKKEKNTKHEQVQIGFRAVARKPNGVDSYRITSTSSRQLYDEREGTALVITRLSNWLIVKIYTCKVGARINSLIILSEKWFSLKYFLRREKKRSCYVEFTNGRVLYPIVQLFLITLFGGNCICICGDAGLYVVYLHHGTSHILQFYQAMLGGRLVICPLSICFIVFMTDRPLLYCQSGSAPYRGNFVKLSYCHNKK